MLVHWWICWLIVRVSIESLSHIVQVTTACSALGIELLRIVLELVVVLKVLRHSRAFLLGCVLAGLVELVHVD